MKNLTALFGFGVAGVVVCFVMTVVVAVQEHRIKSLPAPEPIAVPAIGQ